MCVCVCVCASVNYIPVLCCTSCSHKHFDQWLQPTTGRCPITVLHYIHCFKRKNVLFIIIRHLPYQCISIISVSLYDTYPSIFSNFLDSYVVTTKCIFNINH